MQSINRYIKFCFTCTALIFFTGACRKFIEVKAPATSINSLNVYQNEGTAFSVLTGMYDKLVGNGYGGSFNAWVTRYTDLLADNLTPLDNSGNGSLPYYRNELSATNPSNNPNSYIWSFCYQQIYVANAAIEGLESSSSISVATRQRLLGEARFFRAFYFFYLVNLYGDVPLTVTTDYKTNAVMGRTSGAKVYQQIINDLKEAKNLLSDKYLGITMQTTDDRIRVNKAAATALLARSYLYSGQWADAETEATQLINNDAFHLETMDGAFLKGSQETIWALQTTGSGFNTWEGALFIISSAGPSYNNGVSLSGRFISSFEAGDKRLASWTGHVTANGKTYNYAYKYKAPIGTTAITEYDIVLRLSEQYLIRAEARFRLGRLTGENSAANDLNAVRERAGLSGTTVSSSSEMLDAILKERRAEFFTEWGHRWLDLKRMGKIDEVMSVETPLKVGTWAYYKALFPILQSEIDANPGMKGQQNPHY